MKGAKILAKLLNRKDAFGLFAVDKLLTMAIPFNAPHGFKILSISDEEVRISMKNKKLNHNHLAGMHACAIATLGEYCAGMTFVKHLGLDKYRLIMKELRAEYYLQGRTDITGVAKLNKEQVTNLLAQLQNDDKAFFQHQTDIYNTKDEKIATIHTLWQLKEWGRVKLK